MEPQNQSKKIIGIIIGVIVILAVFGVIIFSVKKPTDAPVENIPVTPPVTSPITPVTPPVDKPKPTTSVYKDGTYNVIGSYSTHAGREQIGVSLTLKKDIISDVSVTPKPADNVSAHYQDLFISGYKPYVIGKNISSLSLGKISGSSLTPNGFNDALTQIKAQAKA